MVATLIYLATQIRQNNKNLEEFTSASISASFMNVNSRISSDEQLAEIFVRSLHYDPFEVFSSLYQKYPGIRAVMDSMEPITPRDLVGRFRTSKPSFGLIAHDKS